MDEASPTGLPTVTEHSMEDMSLSHGDLEQEETATILSFVKDYLRRQTGRQLLDGGGGGGGGGGAPSSGGRRDDAAAADRRSSFPPSYHSIKTAVVDRYGSAAFAASKASVQFYLQAYSDALSAIDFDELAMSAASAAAVAESVPSGSAVPSPSQLRVAPKTYHRHRPDSIWSSGGSSVGEAASAAGAAGGGAAAAAAAAAAAGGGGGGVAATFDAAGGRGGYPGGGTEVGQVWLATMDAASGFVYFYNAVTSDTSWALPPPQDDKGRDTEIMAVEDMREADWASVAEGATAEAQRRALRETALDLGGTAGFGLGSLYFSDPVDWTYFVHPSLYFQLGPMAMVCRRIGSDRLEMVDGDPAEATDATGGGPPRHATAIHELPGEEDEEAGVEAAGDVVGFIFG